jgi:hypothetical protein
MTHNIQSRPERRAMTNLAHTRRKTSPGQLISLRRRRLSELDACLGRIVGIDRRLHELGVPFPVRLSPLPDRGKVVAALHDTWDWLHRWTERSQPKQAREDRIEPEHTRVDRSKLARQLAEALPHSRVTAISLYHLATGLSLRESGRRGRGNPEAGLGSPSPS